MKAFLQRRFYFLMAVLTTAVVLYGFLPRLDARLLHPPAPVPVAVYVHTAVYSLWLVVLLVQTGLIQARQIALHRKLGYASLALGVAVVVVGVWVAIVTTRLHLERNNGPRGPAGTLAFLLVPFSNMAVFATFFGLGILWRKQPERHRRLMLLAAVSLTVAAFARFPHALIPPGGFNTSCDLLIGLALLRDYIVDRKVHPVYVIGLPALIASQVLVVLVGATAWWQEIARGILQ